MIYTPPNFEELKNINLIREKYQAQHQNPERTKLLDVLECLTQFLIDYSFNENELLIGIYLFCIENIKDKYHLFSPQHQRGIFFNSGSLLYSILISHLQINEKNTLPDTKKLYYIMKLYYFFHEHTDNLELYFINKNLDINKIKKELFVILQMTFRKLSPLTDQLLKSLPHEKKLDRKMKEIKDLYLFEKKNNAHNEARIFLIEIISSLPDFRPCNMESIRNLTHINQSFRIKIGALIYVMQSIKNTYYFRSPKNNNSILYCLSQKALNITDLHELHNQLKLDCLTSFYDYLKDAELINYLEKKLEKSVTHLVFQVREELHFQISNLSANSKKISTFTISTAILGALIMSAPGYGFGFTLGCGLSKTNFVFQSKILFNNVTEYMTKNIFNNTGHYITQFASNMIIDTSLERACAKLFESLAMIMGAVSGGTIGMIIFDLSYQTVKSLCQVYQLLNPLVNPFLIKDIDETFIETLLTMPESLFPQHNKNKLKEIAFTSYNQEDAFLITTNLAKS